MTTDPPWEYVPAIAVRIVLAVLVVAVVVYALGGFG